MKSIYIIILMLFANLANAHQPDLSNLMIYEQNGKHLLLIKSSLSAFEGEVDFKYNKNAYKTPEEFKALVLKHFQVNCLITMNNETIKFINPQVILGHETTIFAELSNVPKNITKFYIKNDLFKDIHDSQSELILLLNGLPKKQLILNEENEYQISLKLENKNWIVEEAILKNFSNTKIILLCLAFLIILGVGFVVIKKTSANRGLAKWGHSC